jgi:hypothetical protein
MLKKLAEVGRIGVQSLTRRKHLADNGQHGATELPKEEIVDITEIHQMIQFLNAQDVYLEQKLQFVLRPDQVPAQVQVLQGPKVIQHLSLFQVKTLYLSFKAGERATKGGLLNISC